MTVEYVDAGEAIDQGRLSGKTAGGDVAPPVVADLAYERILNARSEPENWLTYYGAYNGQRYSPLDQINTENVKRLGPAWIFQAGTTGLIAGASTYSFEAAPIVVNGIMFLSGWDGWVWALDAKTGTEIWRYKHATPFDVSLCCGNVNRGVAVAKGKVFTVTPNAHLLALDATTGKRVWDRTYGDVRAGESATVAPLIVKNMVIVGSSGGEFGVRGHLDAFDIDTGEHAWRCYTVPKPGEPGSETWPADGEAWARGGANCWITGTFDAETNLLYVGTGNPAPDFDGGVREGDNLYTDSIIAVDVDAGQIRWHYQCTPHDLWDYDSIGECILFESDGRKLLGHFDKNGYFFVLDRTNGELVQITPFVDRITWGAITRDGRVTPKVYPDKEGEPVHFYPGPAGAKEWTHAAYSPKTGFFYVPVQDVGATATRRRREFKESIPYWGAGVQVDIEDMIGPSARSTPPARRSGAGATSFRCARRCWRRAATWCSPANPQGSSTRSTPAPESSCGSSSAEAATTAARRPTWSTAGSTSPWRSDGVHGPRDSSPACSVRATEVP
jgi:alcohol dehydrogenase (cytochrome c)